MTKYTSVQSLRDRCREVGQCWEWSGCLTSTKHPSVNLNGKMVLARRLMATLAGKPIAKGKRAYMRCENPLCINPDHIIEKTHQQIMKRQGELGKLGGITRSSKIAAIKRAGPQAKLTIEIVREIRAASTTHKVEAERRGVHPSKIAAIRQHRCWREYDNNPWVGLGSRK